MSPFATARYATAFAAAAAAALALSACGAGQISQTASQVAAVDGAQASTESGKVAVRDVTVLVDPADQQARVKFTAINVDTDMNTYTLQSVEAGGQKVALADKIELSRNCTAFSDSKEALAKVKKTDAEGHCISYVPNTVENPGFAAGGTVPVVFDFGDAGTITIDATITAPVLEAGQTDRNPYGPSGDENERHNDKH